MFFTVYGCDRFALVQAEYRGNLSFRFNWSGRGWWDDDKEDEERYRESWDADVDWVLFADAGHGWSTRDGLGDDTGVDAGFGLLFDELGVYAAVPLRNGRGVNLFVRLGSAFDAARPAPGGLPPARAPRPRRARARAGGAPPVRRVGGGGGGVAPRGEGAGLLADPGLRDALGSGLPLRIRFRVELWEKSLFDRLVGTHRAALAVLQDPLDGGYTLDDGRSEQRFRSLAEVEGAVEGAFAASLHPTRRGRFYYIAVLEIETLSLSDLEELQRWLRGEARPAVEGRRSVGRAVESGLRRAVVRVMGLPTRKYEARSATFSPR